MAGAFGSGEAPRFPDAPLAFARNRPDFRTPGGNHARLGFLGEKDVPFYLV